MDNRLQWAIKRILERIHPKFFGTITLTFQDGKLHKLDCNETEMAPKG